MKLDALLFLEATGAVAHTLLKAGPLASNLKKRGDGYMLFCQLVSNDFHYFHVRVPCPLKEQPNGVALLMIPHAEIRLVMQSDQKKVLGFAGSA